MHRWYNFSHDLFPLHSSIRLYFLIDASRQADSQRSADDQQSDKAIDTHIIIIQLNQETDKIRSYKTTQIADAVDDTAGTTGNFRAEEPRRDRPEYTGSSLQEEATANEESIRNPGHAGEFDGKQQAKGKADERDDDERFSAARLIRDRSDEQHADGAADIRQSGKPANLAHAAVREVLQQARQPESKAVDATLIAEIQDDELDHSYMFEDFFQGSNLLRALGELLALFIELRQDVLTLALIEPLRTLRSVADEKQPRDQDQQGEKAFEDEEPAPVEQRDDVARKWARDDGSNRDKRMTIALARPRSSFGNHMLTIVSTTGSMPPSATPSRKRKMSRCIVSWARPVRTEITAQNRIVQVMNFYHCALRQIHRQESAKRDNR